MTVGVTHDDIAALEFGTDRRGLPRPFLPFRAASYPPTPDQARRMVERYREAHPDIVAAAAVFLTNPPGAPSWVAERYRK